MFGNERREGATKKCFFKRSWELPGIKRNDQIFCGFNESMLTCFQHLGNSGNFFGFRSREETMLNVFEPSFW